MSIKVDPEFKALIPPLTPDEYTQLEKNILKDGIRDALIVWPQPDGNDILIDGHNRFEISAAHAGIRFNIKRMEFDGRDEAKQWIILNQFGRRNLSAYARCLLALELKPMFAERAKETQGARTDICQKSDKSIDTKKELAKIAGVSHDTMHKAEAIANSSDKLLKEKVRSGEVSINKAYSEVRRREREKLPTAEEHRAQVEERHEAAKTKTVISMPEVQQDRDDRKYLANETRRDITKALDAVNNVFLLIADGRINTKQLDDENRATVLAKIATTSGQLELMREKIEREQYQ